MEKIDRPSGIKQMMANKRAHRNTVELLVGHACYACEGDGHYVCELTGHRRACPVCMGTGVDDSDDPYDDDEPFDGLVPVSNTKGQRLKDPQEVTMDNPKTPDAGLCSSAPAGSVCSECHLTNVSLVNLGYFGKPRWVCQGCCRSALEVVDAVRKALTPNIGIDGISVERSN